MKFYHVLYFVLLGFMLYHGCSSVFKENSDEKNNTNQIADSIRLLKDSAASSTSQYQERIGKLEQRDDSLLWINDSLQSELIKAELRFQPTARRLDKALAKNWQTMDTTARLANCDTLRKQIDDYRTEQKLIDSLTQENITILMERLSVAEDKYDAAENARVVCNSLFLQMTHRAEAAEKIANNLQQQLNNQQKKTKRWKRLSAILTGAGALFGFLHK